MKVLITGGGTGGHIYPGIAIADTIRLHQPDAEILFVGATQGMEKELVPRAGYPISFIQVEGFRRKLSGQTVTAIRKMFRGYGQARKIIREFDPDVVVGTGGYVSGPVLAAAWQMGKKTLVHEQNVVPGVTVKLLSHVVSGTLTSFPETDAYIKRNVILCGNPLSPHLFDFDSATARQNLGLDERPVLLAYGGSLGARRINETVCELLENTAAKAQYQMIFGTGKREFERVQKRLEPLLARCPHIQVHPYLYQMNQCMAAADVVISRAGAMTVSELAALGKPAILIPSPNVAHNHQEGNARALEQRGGAIVLTERELSAQRLQERVEELLHNQEIRSNMGDCAKTAGITDAAETIYRTILELIQGK